MRTGGLALAVVGALIFAGGLLLLWPRFHSGSPDGNDVSTSNAADYHDEIQPILAKHCYACHNAKKAKAKLNLEAFADEASILKARKTWKKIYDQINAREMPPEEKPRIPAPELEKLTAWIEATLDRPDPNAPRDPGRVVMRRLNRVEYRNTIRDLVGIDFNPNAEDFPSDDVGYGFDNIGDVLSMPPILMEKYLAAAEKILDTAIVSEDRNKPKIRRFDARNMQVSGGGAPEGDMLVMFANGESVQSVDIAEAGKYLLRIRAAGEQAGGEPAKMALLVDGRPIRVIEVPVTRKDAKVYEEKVELRAGPRKITTAFINDYYNPEAKPKDRDRNLILDYLEVVGPVDLKPPDPPESHQRLFFTKPGPSLPKRQAAAEVVGRFAKQAFRRPLAPAELERFLALYDLAEKQGDPFEASVKLPLQAVLVSPHFLFRIEHGSANRDVDPSAKGGAHRLGDYELASRLSYFLWSTMPDAELFDAAEKGNLHEPAAYEAQVRRMLKDRKARSLAENFAIQWLQLRRLETHAPDPKRFPAWDEKLRAAMHDEAVLLFDEIVRDDKSVLDLLGATYTYLNERLAKHYGIEGVKGPELRRVELADPRRGGVLTMGAVLTVTSNPTRTAAVKRGKWVLETILGTPPPPPLPDAGELKDETDEDRKLSLRQRLEKHRADPSCAACHKRMDPIGFAFENYDPIGAWRDRDGAHAVESAASLPDGSSFKGPVELKALILSRKDDFVRCLTEKMATYALGRGVEYYDASTVKGIRKALADNQYRISTLVMEIAKSYPFQFRRDRVKGSEEVKDE
jgi:mono/diheme cytochrome c family protein